MKKFLILILLCSSLILKATTYYVSNSSGSDSNNGLTGSTPWKTLAYVSNSARNFQPGDSILFKAGDSWRESLTIRATGNSSNWVYWGRYGSGDNPMILGSEVAKTWSATGTSNIWQATGTFTDYYTGYTYKGNIFFYLNNWDRDSLCWGNNKVYSSGFTNLTTNYDWTINGTTLYIYCNGDPNSLYDSVEVTQREQTVTTTYNTSPVNYMEWNGIDLRHARRQGFLDGYPEVRNATSQVFRNCNVSYIGERGSGSAYGLALFHSNLLVENCTFSDCGRRALSLNTYEAKTYPDNVILQNIIARNNTFKRGWHTTSMDLSNMAASNDTLKNVYFYNNYIDDGDISNVLYTSNGVYTQCGSGGNWVDSVYIVGNVFAHNTARNIQIEGGGEVFIWNNTVVGHNPNVTTNPWQNVNFNGCDSADFRNNIVMDDLPDNSIENYGVTTSSGTSSAFSEKDYNLYYTSYPSGSRVFSAHRVNNTGSYSYWNTNQWSSYLSSNTLFEQHSPTPQLPDFVSYANEDYSLTDSSVAVNAGAVLPYITAIDPFGNVDTINKYDIASNLISRTSPDLGAYQFVDRRSKMDKIKGVYASSGDASVTVDGSFSGYWNAYGNVYIIYSFTEPITLDAFCLSTYISNLRRYYFNIQVSSDSTTWNTILTDTTDLTVSESVGFQTFFFTKRTFKYFRINGTGNSANTSNAYQEIFFPALNSTIESSIQHSTPLRIAWIGNSYTGYGTIPYRVQNLASSHGWPTPVTKFVMAGGQSLTYHKTYASTISMMNDGNWDYIILQDLSTRTFSDTINMKNDVLWFYDSAKVTSPNVKVWLYCHWAAYPLANLYSTWGDWYKHQFDSVQSIIDKGYTNAMNYVKQQRSTNDIATAYTGDNFPKQYDLQNPYTLHAWTGSDWDNHLSDTGYYLNSLGLYHYIFQTPVTGCFKYSEIPEQACDTFHAIVDGVSLFSSISGEETPQLSNSTDITAFVIIGQYGGTSINTTNHTVTLQMPYGTDLTNLAPTIGISSGATINPASGMTQNFTNLVEYMVTAEDGITQQVWLITVTNINIPTQLSGAKGKKNGKWAKNLAGKWGISQ